MAGVAAVTIEERVAALEAELAAIRARLDTLVPPKRDVTGTTNASTERAWQPVTRAPAQARAAFGFTSNREEA